MAGRRDAVPVVYHLFHDLKEATQAAAWGEHGFSLELPRPPVAHLGAQLCVCLRIGFGPKWTAVGTQASLGGRTLLVHFVGGQAELLVRAFTGFAAEHKVRAFTRYPCRVPAVVQRVSGPTVEAVGTTISLGGLELAKLSDKLVPGERVRLRVEGVGRNVYGRVVWTRGRTHAAVVFERDGANRALVQRLVTELSLR